MMIPIADVPAWHASRKDPSALAIVQGAESLTWRELEARATRRAHFYVALGVKPGDFVAVTVASGIAFFEISFAVWKVGATICPLPDRLSAEETRTVLDLLKPTLVIGEGVSHGPWRRADINQDVGSMPDVPLRAPIARYWAAILSGGSTGRPKIIVQHMMALTGQTYRVPPGLEPGYRVLNPGAPLYHAAPFLFAHWTLFGGGQAHLMPEFDPEAVLRQVEAKRIDWLYLVPTMMHRIWMLPEAVRASYDLSSLKTILHTAAPIAPWLKEAWLSWLGPDRIIESYGGTENMGGCAIRGDEWLLHKGSAGHVDPHSLRILDADGDQVPRGEVGEVYFRAADGPGSTFHYIGAQPRRARDGWETLGDFGHVDADGYLFLTDRCEDMIIRAGVNIFPAEIEAALLAHPDVLTCVVIGLPDEDLGQRIHAIVQLAQGVDIRAFADRIDPFLERRLMGNKRPASYEASAGPLRNAAGKARRFLLREQRLQWLAAGRDFETPSGRRVRADARA